MKCVMSARCMIAAFWNKLGPHFTGFTEELSDVIDPPMALLPRRASVEEQIASDWDKVLRDFNLSFKKILS